jgi:hypothetical protein
MNHSDAKKAKSSQTEKGPQGSQSRMLETLKLRGKEIPTQTSNNSEIQNSNNSEIQHSELPNPVGRPKRERAEPVEQFGTKLPVSIKKRFQKACVLLEKEQQEVILELIEFWLAENEPKYTLK